jgi:hypothetical protein
MSAIVRTAVAASELNYLWPQYSLPWNNFFGRIRPNPWYLSNQLRNVAIREVHSPLTYDSKVNTTFLPTIPAAIPTWTDYTIRTSKPISETATKIFVGRYFDTNVNINGFEYQYNLTGSQVLILDNVTWSDTGLVILSANLANSSLTENLPVYVDTAVCNPCKGINQTSSLNRCDVGSTQNFFNTLTGLVTVDGFPVPLINPLPYTDACHACPTASYFKNSNAVYSILGNKLYLAVVIPKPVASTPLRTIGYTLSLRVVEVSNSGFGLGIGVGLGVLDDSTLI